MKISDLQYKELVNQGEELLRKICKEYEQHFEIIAYQDVSRRYFQKNLLIRGATFYMAQEIERISDDMRYLPKERIIERQESRIKARMSHAEELHDERIETLSYGRQWGNDDQVWLVRAVYLYKLSEKYLEFVLSKTKDRA